jgi:hypothetical protein
MYAQKYRDIHHKLKIQGQAIFIFMCMSTKEKERVDAFENAVMVKDTQ